MIHGADTQENQHMRWVGQTLKGMGKVRSGPTDSHTAVLNFRGSMPKSWRPPVKRWKQKGFSGICAVDNQTTRGLFAPVAT